MTIRDRIKELRRVPASQLRPNPRNWRKHPPAQRGALRGILDEVGYANAMLARELEDGSLELIDGHLRAEITPDQIVPVLVLDVDQAEADKLLATFDPLSTMAIADQEMLNQLAADVESQNEFLNAMLNELTSNPIANPAEITVPESYQIVVDCNDEQQQQHLYQQLRQQGHTCRVLTL